MANSNSRFSPLGPENTPGKARRPLPLDRLSEIENENAALPPGGDAGELTLYDDEVAGDEAALDVADEASMREFYGRLVTLLTQDNEAAAGRKKGGNPFVVALRRRWLPALFLMGLAFFGLYSLLKPRQATYTASTMLLLPPREQTTSKDPFAPPEDSYDTAAQLAIISSDKIVASALNRVPAELRQRGWGDPKIKRVPVNANSLASDSLITISTASLDPKASSSLIDEMVVAYRDYTNGRYSQNKGENLSSTQARLKKTGLDLAKARRELRDYKERTGIFDATSQQSSSATRNQRFRDRARHRAPRSSQRPRPMTRRVQELRQRATDAGAKLRDILRDFRE